MNLSILKNKNIAFLGLGIENLALIKYLLNKKMNCQMTICDFKDEASLGEKFLSLKAKKNVHWKLGKEANNNLSGFDILFRSPGWPLFDRGLVEAKKMKVQVVNPIEFFLQICPTRNIIGVTGSKGKGTTSSLIYHILKTAGKRVWLAGNIGVAPFDLLSKMKKNDWVVLELSSFQLEDMETSPKISVFNNFFNEHLAPADPNNPNYHKSRKDYWRAKINIFKHQKKQDYLIVNHELRIKNQGGKSKILTFSNKNFKADCYWLGDKIRFHNSCFSIHTSLPGEHNKKNIAAAVAVAKTIGIKNETIAKAIKSFTGLEHRIEFVKKIKDVSYYNDSFATTPESAIIALKAFQQPIILLAGGAEKNSGFKELAKEIKKKIKFLILFKGDSTPRLKAEVIKTGFSNRKIKIVNSMKEAVVVARKVSTASDVVLMSPACASFGMFKNYKQRGKLFKQEVEK